MEQAFTGVGWGDAAGGADEQAKTKALLKFTDSLTEGGLRNAELGGGLREAALFRDGEESEESVEGFSWRSLGRIIRLSAYGHLIA
jgi:hypothetical protein